MKGLMMIGLCGLCMNAWAWKGEVSGRVKFLENSKHYDCITEGELKEHGADQLTLTYDIFDCGDGHYPGEPEELNFTVRDGKLFWEYIPGEPTGTYSEKRFHHYRETKDYSYHGDYEGRSVYEVKLDDLHRSNQKFSLYYALYDEADKLMIQIKMKGKVK